MKQRDSSIELLRVILMFIIIIGHYSHHGCGDLSSCKILFNRYILQVVKIGEWAVDAFIIIFGYYGFGSQFKLKRITNLYAQVWFYSVFCFLAVHIITNTMPDIGVALRCFFPILGDQYWFFSRYIILSLLSPYLNKLIERLPRHLNLRFIVVFLALWCVVPMISKGQFANDLQVSRLGIFILLYYIGAYMRKYPNCKAMKKSNGMLMVICTTSYMLFQHWQHLKIINFDSLSNRSIFSIAFAVGMFNVFKNLKMKENRIINIIGSCTFGIYLIHDNSILRFPLWNVLRANEYINNTNMIFYMIMSSIIIFIACLIVELIRKKTVQQIWTKHFEPYILKGISYACKVINI